MSHETEPIFCVHIDFSDGSNPVDYYNLALAQACQVLENWSEDWILTPDPNSSLADSVWYWHAHARDTTD